MAERAPLRGPARQPDRKPSSGDGRSLVPDRAEIEALFSRPGADD